MESANRRGSLAIGAVVLLVVFLLLTRCTGAGGGHRVGAVPNDGNPAQPAATGDPNADPALALSGDLPAEPGTLTVDGGPLLPLSRADGVGPGGDLTGLSGRKAIARGARVLSVPADEGFWLGTDETSDSDRVWVQLSGRPPESPYVVVPGDTVSFTATISANGRNFAGRVGVTEDEGAATLTAQRQHLSVPKQALAFDQPSAP